MRKTCFFGNFLSFYDFRKLNKDLVDLLWKTFWLGYENRNLCIHGNILRKYIFLLEKTIFFSSISEAEQKHFSFLSKISRQVCRNSILRVQWNTSKKNFFSTWPLSGNFLYFWQKLPRQGCQNCTLRIRRNNLRIFLKKICFLIALSESEQKNIRLFSKIFGRNCQNCIPRV